MPSVCQVLLGSEYVMVRSEGEVRDTLKGYTSDINLERAERQRADEQGQLGEEERAECSGHTASVA